jgi:ubiquinone/menaquinone biosynthesis C-methylase UbiE
LCHCANIIAKNRSDRNDAKGEKYLFMNHQDHVNLIIKGIPQTGGTWADFGSGHGAFTQALAEVIGEGGTIYSIDRDQHALKQQMATMNKQFPTIMTHLITADFTQPLDIPILDGIIMANSLHFISDKLPVLTQLMTYLKPKGRLILIEYNTNQGNRWVPYPLTYAHWERLAQQAGFVSTTCLMTRPSSFLGEFFSALSITA